MLLQIDLEMLEASEETAMFLSPPQATEPSRHDAAGVSVAAIAARGLFGGLAVDVADECVLHGVFRQCQDQSVANAKIITLLANFQDSSIAYDTEYTTEHRFGKRTSCLKRYSSRMGRKQDKNRVLVPQELKVYEENFLILYDSDQLLFANPQSNFNFDTVTSSLAMKLASFETQRSALFAFNMNVLNSSGFAWRTFADVAYSKWNGF